MIEQILNAIPSDQPVWVYALAALIPFCMLLALREFVCWFWKLNALVSRLDRIERALLKLESGSIESSSSKRGKATGGASSTSASEGKQSVSDKTSRGTDSSGVFKLE